MRFGKLLSILFFLVFATQAGAATRYVDGSLGADCTSGNYSISNRNCTGSDGNAWNTIGEGIQNTSQGDILYVRAGTYGSINSNSITLPGGTSYANAPLIARYQSEVVTISGSAALNLAFPSGQSQTSLSYLIFDGLKFSNNGSSDSTVSFWGAVHNVRIQNCEISGAVASHSGILINTNGTTDPTNGEILNCQIHDNGDDSACSPTCSSGQIGHGIYLNSSDGFLFRGNEVYSNGHYCVQFYPDPTNAVWERNHCHDNQAHLANGGTTFYGSGHQIRNNLMVNEDYCIRLSGSSQEVYNNTLVSCDIVGIDRQVGSHTVKNNIIAETSDPFTTSTGLTCDNNLSDTADACVETTENPVKFVNAAGGDYQLQSSSVAKDGGLDLSAEGFSNDFDDVSRPQGISWDIGAFEFIVAGGGTPRAPSNARVAASGRTQATGRTAATARGQCCQ